MDSIDKTIRMNNLSKELRKYGFAQSSQDAIAQAGEIYGSDNEQLTAEIETVQLSKAQFNEIINKMQRLWMFKENTNQHICAMADQLVKVTDKLNELIKNISMIEMNQGVFDKKLEMLKNNIHENFREESKPSNKKNRSSEHVAESSEKEVQQHLEQPIDRNGVAPADVSIEKIFYCGIKK
ncbi:MAG: hypothetical protein KKF46_00905 [Nanoarchaeota archaeon]|nr:hypothetical protein [Nanoarchaeota archaeon]MBU1320893.1 hypothetical protein [Nanoarchaeota archaeon]MBU1597583.1 hypothetical protein [Nanoarchaeota archaeon]MBU2441502.1 hypothetical protein [Nanoarchaeota archaeon]